MNVVHFFQPHHLVADLLSLTSDAIIDVGMEAWVYDLF